MPKLLEIEESGSELPLLAILGENEPLVQYLLHEFANKFRLILISEKKPLFLAKASNVYFLDYKNAALLPNLKETLDYALVLVDSHVKEFHIAPLFSKVILDKAKILFLHSALSLEHTIIETKPYKDYHHSFFGIIGETISQKKLEDTGDLSKIIENAIAKREIHLTGNEAFPVFGTMQDDLLVAIGRLLFGNFKNDKCFLLYYQHPQTVLETAHLIGRVDLEIKISFSDVHRTAQGISHQNVAEIVKQTLHLECLFVDNFYQGFEKGYASLLENKESLLENHKINKVSSSRKKIPVNTSYISFISLSFFWGIFLFIFLNFFTFGLSILFFKNSINALQKNDFQRVIQNAKASSSFLSFVTPTASLLFDGVNYLDKKKALEDKFFLMQRAVRLMNIAGNSPQLLTKKEVDLHSLTSALSNLSYLYQEGQRLILETESVELKKQLKPTYSKLLSFTSIIPYVLGFDSTRNYLLLFQNDEELRPTGGFIGSIGDLSIQKGKVQSLTIQDVYELDGQLKNHVEPPFIVRRYIQPHLYLRDSNFFLNYQEAASTSAFIYNLESGKQPDGVIAIDLRVLKEILRVSGPIKLPNYNVTVSSDNVSNFLQSTIKDNFFPGSTQKKDVLNSVFTQLTMKISNDQKFYIALLKLLPDLFEQKDILVSYSNNSVQKIFSSNNYAGEYSYKPSSNAKTIDDFLYINEANISVNKVNAQIKREATYETMFEQGRVVSKARLILTNASKTDDYKVYVKFVVPAGSALQQVLINDVKQNLTPAITDFKVYEGKNFKPPIGLETEQYTIGNLTYFAFITTAKLGKTTSIGIDYINGAGKPLSTITDYSLSYVKQPGTAPYQLTTTFDYPEGYMPVDSHADSYGRNFMEEKIVINNDYNPKLELQKSSVQK